MFCPKFVKYNLRIITNEITKLKQINLWCFICERGVKMAGE
jgi:hypothetical protein